MQMSASLNTWRSRASTLCSGFLALQETNLHRVDAFYAHSQGNVFASLRHKQQFHRNVGTAIDKIK